MSLVSIFIPAFNAEKYIADTIRSVVAQSYANWELLVLDDCSEDNTYEAALVAAANDSRIRVIKNESNLGMSGNWNKGIALSKNKYVVKLDADDIWNPGFLERSVDVMETHPNVGLLFCRTMDIDGAGNIIDGTEVVLPDFVRNKEFSCIPLVQLGCHRMLQYPILRQGLSLVRKRVLEEVGGYLNIRSADTEFYFRVGSNYNLYYIDETLYLYRMHSNSDSNAIDKEGKRDVYLHEVTNHILDYYYRNQKLSSTQFKKFSNENAFRFLTSRINYFRKNQMRFTSCRLLAECFFRFPLSSFSFYINRLQARI